MRVELTPARTIVEVDDAELEGLRDSFQRSGYVKLPRILAPELARDVYERAVAKGFEDVDHEGIGRELMTRDTSAYHLLALMLNAREMIDFVSRVTRKPVAVFWGRIYRLASSGGYSQGWHSDDVEERVAAISINLGEPFEGARLRIREVATERALAEVENTVRGDAVLFRIAPEIEHCNTAIVGDVPKTACAGFFQSRGTFRETLAREL